MDAEPTADALWRTLCAEGARIWAGVLEEARGVAPERATTIYARGVDRLLALLARMPTIAVAPGGLFDVVVRCLTAALSEPGSAAAAALARAVAHLQTALAAHALAQRDVVVAGCAAFGRRLADAPGPRSLSADLALWIDSMDAAHAAAQGDPEFVESHAAVVNALSAVTLALRAVLEPVRVALDRPARAEIDRLEARIAALEARLAPAPAPRRRPRAASPKRAAGDTRPKTRKPRKGSRR